MRLLVVSTKFIIWIRKSVIIMHDSPFCAKPDKSFPFFQIILSAIRERSTVVKEMKKFDKHWSELRCAFFENHSRNLFEYRRFVCVEFLLAYG